MTLGHTACSQDHTKFLGSVTRKPKIIGSSLRNFSLRKRWEGTGFLIEWLGNGTDSVVVPVVIVVVRVELQLPLIPYVPMSNFSLFGIL